MSIDTILDKLNTEQQRAVLTEKRYALILAGAGSGKTRVLVHHIAWLLQEKNILPGDILAVTFTNKAAMEMRDRIQTLAGISLANMWVGTFHSIAHRLLRIHHKYANLPSNFQVIDADDQLRLLKAILKDLKISDKDLEPKALQYAINGWKDRGLRTGDITAGHTAFEQMRLRCYKEYEVRSKTANLVDFSELLLAVTELFNNHPELRQNYQQRFKYILVDEFQDTNNIQYNLLLQLNSGNNSFFMVGDDDQLIYSWRGANISHMQKFVDNFNDVDIIKLERNYRSTEIILQAANAVINYNQQRLGKNLWTEHNSGKAINVYNAINEQDEAYFVVNEIKKFGDNVSYRDIAILYRSNAQSRTFEDSLLKFNVPYRIYGGLRFYERAEIKDALAYLRLIANEHDDTALERVINWPTRGVGEKTIAELRALAIEMQISLWQVVQHLLRTAKLANSKRIAFTEFCNIIMDSKQCASKMQVPELIEYVIQRSGLLAYYKQLTDEKSKNRVENLHELISASSTFLTTNLDEDLVINDPLQCFLTKTVLDSDNIKEQNDAVNLMTIHAAKGLEFNTVFLVGMEDGLLPHQMSLLESKNLEEERRLCYVGITRAKNNLYFTHAARRFFQGRKIDAIPSRFLREIPQKYMHKIASMLQRQYY